jgi:hypothetical protein
MAGGGDCVWLQGLGSGRGWGAFLAWEVGRSRQGRVTEGQGARLGLAVVRREGRKTGRKAGRMDAPEGAVAAARACLKAGMGRPLGQGGGQAVRSWCLRRAGVAGPHPSSPGATEGEGGIWRPTSACSGNSWPCSSATWTSWTRGVRLRCAGPAGKLPSTSPCSWGWGPSCTCTGLTLCSSPACRPRAAAACRFWASTAASAMWSEAGPTWRASTSATVTSSLTMG